MRTELYLVALILFGETAFSGAALAASAPSFSTPEQGAIARNELLRAVVDNDPWLVRKILDMLRQSRHDGARLDAADPDLTTPRNWQAMVEWNDLIKRARAEKAARAGASSSARSAEGTVEMLDWMQRAKAKKAQSPQ
jgi:hypothetical protein